jgi:hypothetical protein
MVSSSSSLALALVLAISSSSSSLAQYTGKTSTGGLSVDAPQTNPTTCDPATITYTYTGNASWPVTIALTNALVDQYPLADAPALFQTIQLGLPATGSTPVSVNWTSVNIPAGYYVILAEAAPPEGYYNNATANLLPAEASSDRFQVVNGTSTACLYPAQPVVPPPPNHTGAIVGGVIGGLALLLLLLLAACCLRKRNKNKKMARKERLSGAIPIQDQKSTTSRHGPEKFAAAGLGAGILADHDSKTQQATNTEYERDSTRPGSMHTLEDSHHFMAAPTAIAATNVTHEDPFADPRFTGDFGPSQRSSGLDPDHDHIDEVLAGSGQRPIAAALAAGSGSGSFKTARKPAPEYDETDAAADASMHTAQDNEPQQHYLVPDAPVQF